MFTLPDLPYAYNALEPYIDERTMQIHHDKHHATYIKNLNEALPSATGAIEDILKKLNEAPEDVRMKVRNNGGGHANHSLFWNVMRPGKEGNVATGEVGKAIDTAFGSFDQFKEKFSAAGLGRFGSGWVWLVPDAGKLTIVDTPNQDTPLMEGKIPVLGLDVWEHAYYLKYQNMRADYIKNWWNVVNWNEVEKRFVEATK